MTAVLFDIDLTLVHTNGAGRLAMEAALEHYGVTNPTAGIAFDGRTDRAIFEETLQRLGDWSPTAYARLVEGYLELLPGALGRVGGTVLAGVEPLLDALTAEGVPFGLATGNLQRGAMAKLEHFALWERFAGGGFGDSESDRVHVVRAAVADLERVIGGPVDRDLAIVVGDTPLDVAAAHAAGARALGVATGRYSVDELLAAGADWAEPDLSDTATVLETLLGVRGPGTAASALRR